MVNEALNSARTPRRTVSSLEHSRPFKPLCAAQVFQQRHYWAAELGDVVLLGISTVRFRSNDYRQASAPPQVGFKKGLAPMWFLLQLCL